MARLFIPPLMRSLTNGQAELDLPGETLRQVIAQLEAHYPGTRERLCAGDTLRPGLAVAIDGHMSTQGLRHKLQPDSEVHIVPAIGGG